MTDEIMVSTSGGPVRQGPTHVYFGTVQHEAKAYQNDDGTWMAVVRHVCEPLRDKKTGKLSGSIPGAPAVYTTSLAVHHDTEDRAMRHAQIHVDCLNAVRELLGGGENGGIKRTHYFTHQYNKETGHIDAIVHGDYTDNDPWLKSDNFLVATDVIPTVHNHDPS